MPSLPGKVEFENYDVGGKDIAYYDTTASNTGGVYRTNAVDIQATTDTGGGYNLGWTAAREWLKYTVNVTTAGTYAIDVRVASKGGGGTFHIEVNGVNKTGPICGGRHRRLAGLEDGDEDRRLARRRQADRPRGHGQHRRQRLCRQLELVRDSLSARKTGAHRGQRSSRRTALRPQS